LIVARALGLYVAALGAALLFSTLRLWDLALGNAPFALWLPFARPLLSAAFEASLLLGVPLAWLLAFCQVDRIRPRARALALLGCVLVCFSAGGAILTDVGFRAPGRLAQELIETGRSSCASALGRRVDVPLANVAWACPPGSPMIVTGKPPELGGAVFTATALKVSEDLRQLELANLELEVAPKGGRIGARIAVGKAKIVGFPPWGRPRHVPLPLRLAASLLGALATVGACILVSRGNRGSMLPVLLAAVGGIVLLAVQQALDRYQVGALGYLFAAPAGAVMVGVVALVVRGVGRALARLRPHPP
jgi:hypothetical protein